MLRPLLSCLVSFSISACAALSEPAVVGRASVIDGDTLEIQGERVRIWGVDAPESRQLCRGVHGDYRCGQVAANQLDAWINARPVSCLEESRDRYRRMVARCTVGSEDLGAWLVRNGHALRYPEYAGAAYVVEELAARADRAGIWAGTFDRPWDWRRARRGPR